MSSFTPPPPAGWYPNPDGSPTALWWDGRAWVGPPQPQPAMAPQYQAPTPPWPVAPPSEPADIAGILLSIGAVAVLVGGLSFSTQGVAKFLLPLLIIFFAVGCWATYRKQLRVSAEIFFSVAVGLAVYELWIVGQPRSYGSFAQVLRAWVRGDGPTLVTVGAIAAGALVVTGALAVAFKRRGITIGSPIGWAIAAAAIGVLTLLIFVVSHDIGYFEVLTIPMGLVLIAIGENALARNERSSSLETATWGLLVAFIPTSIAAYVDVLGYHALILTVLFVGAIVYGVTMRRKAAFFITPWFYAVYCLCAIVSVAQDVKPWVWLMAGGMVVIACGAFWEKLYQEAKSGRDRLKDLR